MDENNNNVAPATPTSSDISISDVLSKGWALLNENLSTWAMLALIVILPSVILSALFAAMFDVDTISNNVNDLGDATAVAGGSFMAVLAVGIYQLIMYAILFSVYIKVAGGTKLQGVSQALSLGTAKAGKVILATIVVGIIIGFGFVLLIIPGIIALFLLAATVYIVADTDLSLGQAMSLSVEYAKQFFVQIFLIGLTFFLISLALGVVSGIFSDLPSVAYTAITTTLNVALQVFAGLTVAVLYLEMKKRYKKDAA